MSSPALSNPYQGQMVNGKRQGYVEYIYESGNKYSGYWNDDKKHGEGCLYFANGDRIQGNWFEDSIKDGFYIYAENENYYQGTFHDNKYVSGGFFVFKSTGMFYQGEYLDNKFHGSGTIFNPDKSIYYEGKFQNDLFHGQGKIHLPGLNNYIQAVWENGPNSSVAEIFENDVCVFKTPVKNGKKEGKAQFFQSDLNKWGEVFFKNDQIEYILTFHLANNDYFTGQFNLILSGQGQYLSHEGAIFEGTFEKGNLLEGRIIYKNKDVYQGEMKNNERSGKGRYTFSSGSVSYYEGDWLYDQMHGTGVLVFSDKSEYKGSWNRGKMTEGQLFLSNGDKISGVFKDDELFIKGTYFFKNGEKFEGSLLNFKKDGPGKYFWNDESFIEGYWEEDLQEDSAQIVYSDKSRFEGNFSSGQKSGEGIFYYPEGHEILKVTSSYLKGVKHGNEQIDFRDGGVLQVTWTNGRMDEKVLFKSNGYSYEGSLVKGKKVGQGKETFPNNDIYEGFFENDLRSGEGCYRFADGSVFKGKLKNGEFHGQGSLTYSNQDIYSGSFKCSKRSGKGTYIPSKASTVNNGDPVSGTWKEDGKVVSPE